MKKFLAFLNTPLGVAIGLGAVILVTEFSIMVLIESIHATILKDPFLEKLAFEFLDPFVLTAIISPALYLLIFLPLKQQAKLDRQLDELRRVQKVEAALLKSETKFRTVYESSSDAIMLLDEKGFFDCNEATLRMFGCHTRGEFISKHPAELSPPTQPGGEDSMSLANERIAMAFKNGGNRFEWIHRRLDGTDFPAEVLLTTMELDGKAVLQATVRNISERKQAEDALRISSLKYQALFESSRDALLTVAPPSWKFTEANQAALQMFGATSTDEFYVLGPWDVSPERQPDGRLSSEKAQEVIAVAMREGSNFFEWKFKRMDGRVFDADVLLTRTELGERIFIQGTCRDISGRKHAEERLRDSHKSLNRLLNSMIEGAYGVDTNGNCTFVNQSCLQMLGYQNNDEVLGKHMHTLMHHSHSYGSPYPVSECRIYRAYQYLQSINVSDEVFWRKDGSSFPVEYWSNPVVVDGAAEGAIITFVDITGRKLAENKIHELNEELETKVQERTKQLLEVQEELVRKEKLAVLGQVAGSVGHELRNPLGVMSNAVYFLQTVLSDADDTTKEYLNIIKSEIAGSERIVSDLLDAVRTQPPHREIVGVAELIGQTLHKCSVPSSVVVKLDIPATLAPLRVDPLQIHQVFRNLISNGIEAMPEGGVLEISAVENKQDGTVTVSVHDSGIGMTPDQLGHLFQPLFTTKARGIGLGLVVVKNLTEANGGRVEVQSEAGYGTTFTVTLPATNSSVEGAK